MKNSQEKIHLHDYKPFPFEISNIELEFNLNPKSTKVRAIANYKLKNGFNLDTELVLNGEFLELQNIIINEATLGENQYVYENGLLKFSPKLSEFKLETNVIINPKDNKALAGLYVSGGRFCTQCEAEGFRRITFWPDRPDVMSIYKVKIIADKAQYPTLLANGNCVEKGDLGEKHFAIWEDPWRKPSYLFAMVAGKLDVLSDSFTTMENRKVELNIYVDEGDAQKALYAMDSLKRAMKWDEEKYGLAYDLDIFNIVAVRDFNFGAMENKGLNIFNSSLLLADSQSATDFDYGRIEGVIAHEYFHNWSGNRVTCRDWFQLSLKEGLTVFRDQEFSADMRSRSVQRIQDVIALRSRQFAEDAGPNAHPVRPSSYAAIDNFYTSTIYEKGAEIIRITRNILGEEVYFKGAKEYFKNNDGSAATIEDWLIALRTQDKDNKLNGIEKWYSQAGTPILEINSEYSGNSLKLTLSQSTPDTIRQTNKEWVPIPIKLALFSETGAKIPFEYNGKTYSELTYILSSMTSEIILNGVNEKPVASFLRDFSAPVKLKYSQTIEELSILASYDDNAFVKWESLQQISKKCLHLLYENIKSEEARVIIETLKTIFANTIKNSHSDYAFASLLLGIPTLNDLIQEIKNTIPEKLLAARTLMLTEIYRANKKLLEDVINDYDFNSEFKTDAVSAGKRSFLNMVLFIYSYGDDEDNNKLIYDCFKKANNLSDKMAAFTALNRFGAFYFQKAIVDFEAEYSNNPLVMDKWFAVQANSINENICKKLEDLSKHKDFDITNPNRARSIYSSFALNNPVFFNSKDGKGYKFIIDAIEKIDAINNSVAARLATCFERVTQIDESRRLIAKENLISLSNKKISKQLNEIITPIISSL